MSAERGWIGDPQPSVEWRDSHYSRMADRLNAAQHHALPGDQLAVLNILRQAAGLEPLFSPDHSEPEDADGGTRSKGKASNE
jgi:hypothetical protein